MLKITRKESGFLIDKKIYFTESDPQDKYINLSYYKGQDIKYGQDKQFVIEYPGEYDKEGIFIKVIEGSEQKLNYYIRLNGYKIFLLQTPNILEDEEIEKIDYWLYNDEKAEELLDKMELEGERINMITIEY